MCGTDHLSLQYYAAIGLRHTYRCERTLMGAMSAALRGKHCGAALRVPPLRRFIASFSLR